MLDNKVPQTITSFHSVTGRDAHVEIVLVIDAVNDTVVNVGYERLQIDKFLRAEEGRLAYPMAIAIFTDKGIEGVTSFSSDGNALSDALQKNDTGLRDIGRSAAFWGAAERLQLSARRPCSTCRSGGAAPWPQSDRVGFSWLASV